MSGGMYLAAAGAMVQQMRLEVLANNIANINTNGYKGEKRFSGSTKHRFRRIKHRQRMKVSP